MWFRLGPIVKDQGKSVRGGNEVITQTRLFAFAWDFLWICLGMNQVGSWLLFGIVKDQKENLSEMEKLSDECLKLKAWSLKLEFSPPLRPVFFHSSKIAALIENYRSYKFNISSRRQSIKTTISDHVPMSNGCYMTLYSNCPLTRFSTQLLVSFDHRIQLWSQLMLRGSALHKGRK